MGTKFCIVWTRSQDLPLENPDEVLGIYTTRTLALIAAREFRQHDDDEYVVKEYCPNVPDHGVPIWDNNCDREITGARYAAIAYLKEWPAGMPLLQTID